MAREGNARMMDDDSVQHDGARTVTSGDPADWEMLRSNMEDDESRAVLAQLKHIAAITEFHARLHAADVVVTPTAAGSAREARRRRC